MSAGFSLQILRNDHELGHVVGVGTDRAFDLEAVLVYTQKTDLRPT